MAIGGTVAAIFVVAAAVIGLFIHYRHRRRSRQDAPVAAKPEGTSGGVERPGSMSSGSGYRKFDHERGSRASTASRMSWFYWDGKKQPNTAFTVASSSPSVPGDDVPPLPMITFGQHHNMPPLQAERGYGQPQPIMALDGTINSAGVLPSETEVKWMSQADRVDPVGIMGTYNDSQEPQPEVPYSIPEKPSPTEGYYHQPSAGSLQRAQAVRGGSEMAHNRDSILSTDTATPILLSMIDANRNGNARSPSAASTANSPSYQALPLQHYHNPWPMAMAPIPEDHVLAPPNVTVTQPRDDSDETGSLTPVPAQAPTVPKPILKQSGVSEQQQQRVPIRVGPRRPSFGAPQTPPISNLPAGIGMGRSADGPPRHPFIDMMASSPSPQGISMGGSSNGNPFRRPTLPAGSIPSASSGSLLPPLVSPGGSNPFFSQQAQSRHFTPPPVGNPFREPLRTPPLPSSRIAPNPFVLPTGGERRRSGEEAREDEERQYKTYLSTFPAPSQQATKFDPSRISILTESEYGFNETGETVIESPSLILSALNQVVERSPLSSTPLSTSTITEDEADVPYPLPTSTRRHVPPSPGAVSPQGILRIKPLDIPYSAPVRVISPLAPTPTPSSVSTTASTSAAYFTASENGEEEMEEEGEKALNAFVEELYSGGGSVDEALRELATTSSGFGGR
ncbi:hypothetical protein HDU67_007587 [Dinochytrium kinnereticum]|nr:hypothetical protein HDU67_007587 [Dinochytrium kinnereticum]